MREPLYKGLLDVDYLLQIIDQIGSIRGTSRWLNEKFPNLDTTESGIRKFLAKEGEVPTPKAKVIKDARPVASGDILAPDTRRKRLIGKRFIFTSAQNNTYVHENFLASLLRFATHKDAELIISRFTYNKSGFQNDTKSGSDDLWYDHRLKEFIMDDSVEVAEGLVFCGELDILPTAIDPLSGLENYTQGNSGIVPHAKVNLKSLPRLRHEPPRFLYTTGAITQRNYIQRKAGQKADFHHVFGALYVEIDDDGVWFARQLIADNSGEFCDLEYRYTPTGVVQSSGVMAINWGDIHIEKKDNSVQEAGWFNHDSMVKVLNPTYQFIHDLTDFSARNHHNTNDPFINAELHFKERTNVERDLESSSEFLEKISKYGTVVVVESNHDQAYQKWLREGNVQKDPENAEFFHRSNAEIYKHIRLHASDFNVYEWALRAKSALTNVIFLREDDSFVICNDATAEELGKIVGGIECGIHGHRGPNGSRGNSKQFKQIGRKCNLGHSHSAAILDGVYVAGVSGKLDMDYNKGPSSWSHSHIVTYPNGKRAIITMRDGKWRA